MNKYYKYSDEYKSLHNIFFNGGDYTVLQIIESKWISDKEKLELIKDNLN